MARQDIDFPVKDIPLREDVSRLGALVGDVIREQGGDALFEQVEAARNAAIHRRESGEAESERALETVVTELEPAAASELVRAFSTYFQVVNLAEKVHRIRRRRDYLREGQTQRGSLEDAMLQLRREGLALEDALELLTTLRIEPVFTAHPTQATRRAILEKHQEIARRLVDRLDPSLTPPEERAALARIRANVTSAWQTEEHPAARPTVGDEMEYVLFYLTDVIYRVVPAFYEALEGALAKAWGDEHEASSLPTVLRFASWVGGDMDGNPNVTAETLVATLERHRELILGRYRHELAALAARLTQSTSRVEVSPQITELIERYAKLFPGVREAIPPRHRDMPYRALLRFMQARLDATGNDGAGAYETPEELAGDLQAIADSLRQRAGEHAGLFAVGRALRRVDTFGFHLATLDVRQDALVHRQVIGRLLDEDGWLELTAEERTVRLRRALANADAPRRQPGDEDRATFEVFEAIGASRRRFGERAVGPFIISMTQGADDVLSVLLLARWADLADADGRIPLDVAPLFETVPDLQAAPEIVASLARGATYRAHLRARGDRQMIMIGYSDSNKDGGLTASRWALHEAQAALAAALESTGIALTLFHGRGGTVSRGGGKTHRAVLAAPPGTVAGSLRMTEQGESIDAKYGLRGIALRSFERTVGAVTRATAVPHSLVRQGGWPALMQQIAERNRQVYRALVYDDPRFTDYFRNATPIDVIERLAIGSRPASRRQGGGVETLRAIPWVFSWTQSRHLLPGWYGLGSALSEAVEKRGQGAVSEMVRSWLFLRTLLEDVEMVLAKADLGIAARYAALAGEVGEALFPKIRNEFELTVQMVLELTGSESLLEDDLTLRRSIRLRNPYVDPMSLLQVDLLRRWRSTDRQDDDLLQALFATVQGISQGLQNTG